MFGSDAERLRAWHELATKVIAARQQAERVRRVCAPCPDFMRGLYSAEDRLAAASHVLGLTEAEDLALYNALEATLAASPTG